MSNVKAQSSWFDKLTMITLSLSKDDICLPALPTAGRRRQGF